MKDEHDQDTLLFISRATIILPAVVVIIGLVFVGWQKLVAITIPKTESKISPTPEKKVAPIDLNGPYVCTYKSETSSASAFIQNKKIYAKMTGTDKDSTYVLNGDCLYAWEGKGPKGKKMCGIGTMISLLQFSGGLQLPGSQAETISKSCKKIPVPDQSVFNVPKNIQFSDGEISVPKNLE